MTVCIAALCDNYRTLVIAADKRLTSIVSTADTPFTKITPIHQQWATMFAFDDPDPLEDVMRAAKRRIGTDPSVSFFDARKAVVEAYQEVRLRIAEQKYLRSRSWSFQEFKDKGKDKLGESLHQDIDRDISSMDLDLSLLCAGHYQGFGFIFGVTNPGVDFDHAVPGFHAIGSGDTNALTWLHQCGINPGTSVAEATYHVYAAKRYAEHVSTVGTTHDMYLLREHHKQPIGLLTEKLLENMWEAHKPSAPTPNELGVLDHSDSFANLYSKGD